MNMLELWMPVAATVPSVIDNVSWDQAFRDSVRNAGLPMRWLAELEEVDKMRKARQQQQEEMQRQQKQMSQAEMAGKLGGIKEDSVVGRMAAGAANGQRAPAPGGLGL